MTKKTKIILVVIILLLIIGMALYPHIKELFFTPDSTSLPEPTATASSQRQENRTLNVNARIIKYTTLNDEVMPTTGLLMPDEEVDLSFETSGKITNIYFKEGTSVAKGTLLAKVNDKPLQAELTKLNAQLPLAEDRVFRQKSLLAKDAVSQEAYESVNTELEKLKADIELVKTRIAQTELRAPFDGVLGLRLVSEGTYASPTTIISRLTKISPLKLEFSVNENQANEVKAGTLVTFTAGNNLKIYNATVYAVETNLDRSTLTLKARALYPNTDGYLKPGRSVTLNIRLREIKNAIAIPASALIAEMGRDIVYVYKDGRAQQLTIKKGMRTESEVQVLSGLNLGDTILTSGVMQLRDGLPVSIDQINDIPVK